MLQEFDAATKSAAMRLDDTCTNCFVEQALKASKRQARTLNRAFPERIR